MINKIKRNINFHVVFTLIILIIISIGWYSNLGHTAYKKYTDIVYFSDDEAIALEKKGILSSPIDVNKSYFSEQTIEYKKKRTYIPFITKKIDIKKGKKSYFNK